MPHMPPYPPYRGAPTARELVCLAVKSLWVWAWGLRLARAWHTGRARLFCLLWTRTAGLLLRTILPGPGRHPFTESDGPEGREDGKGDVD